MQAQEGKYLTFVLGSEEYGIPIKKVKEIIGMMGITNIPKTPEFVRGVINLRGKIIPILDLRLKFGLEEIEYTQRTCIIVVETSSSDIQKQMGIAVDSVSEVVNIQKGEIEPPPECGTQASIEFLTGLGKVKGKVLLLLDIDRVLNSDELVLSREIK